MRPPKSNGPGESRAAADPTNNFTLERAAILRLPRRECASCGVPFIAHQPWHSRCLQCWRWFVIGISVARARRALVVEREGP